MQTMSDIDDICVISHPLGGASKNHAKTLLNILSAITNVSLVAVSISRKSSLRTEYEIIEITDEITEDSLLFSAIGFLQNQLRMAYIVYCRPESIILFFGVTSYIIPILTAKLMKKTVILQPRGDVPLTLRLQWEQHMSAPVARLLAASVKLLEEIGFRICDHIITYTPSMAKELRLMRFDQKLYTQGARYINLDQFNISQSFNERECRVGFVGRIDEEKGIRVLTEVARQLPPNVTFRFIGDGELRNWVEKELASEIATGDVEVTGWIDHEEVAAELNNLQLLVMPSAPTEGLPTTILESMACGTPVYATPVSGIPSVIYEGKTGFFMNHIDPDKIVEDISSILRRNDLETLSNNARRLMEDEYSFESAVDRYELILTHMSSKGE